MIDLIVKLAFNFYKIAGKLEDLKVNYPGNDSEIDQLFQGDPTNSKIYLEWMINQLDVGNIDDIISNIKYFHRNLNKFEKKNINDYNDLTSLEEFVNEIKKNDFAFAKNLNKNFAKENGKLIYEDEQVKVFRQDSEEAAKYYGTGTNWCVSWADKHRDNKYDNYVSEGAVLYFIISKEKDENKPMLAKIAYEMIRPEDKDIEFIKDKYPKGYAVSIVDGTYFTNYESTIKEYLINYNQILNAMKNDVKNAPKHYSYKIRYNYDLSDNELLKALESNSITVMSKAFSKISEESRTDLIEKILNSKKENTRAVAVDLIPDNRIDLVENMLNDNSIKVRCEAIKKIPEYRIDLFEKILDDENIHVKIEVIKTIPSNMFYLIENMLNHKDDKFRYEVTKKIPEDRIDLIEKMLNDTDYTVRVAAIDKIPENRIDLIEKMLHDSNYNVRYRALNKVPENRIDLFEKMLNDPVEFIRDVAYNSI